MSYHDGSHTGTSIFLNKENLVLSLPLISICALYAFIKYVPLQYGLPVIGSIALLHKISSSLKARAIEKKEEKIAALDEDLLKELAADEITKKEREEQKAANKKKKADEKIRQRIAAEKKAKIGSTVGGEEDDEDEDLATFVKGGRNGKSKKR